MTDDEQVDEADDVQDETELSDDAGITYSISWYGADYPVELLVSRLKSSSFYIPEFQRGYVWTLKQASRFIESLLLGLPVPAVFIAKDPDGPGHMVIDGQQRLRTLQYFYSSLWKNKIFKLQDVGPSWNGRTIEDLTADDRQRLDDTIIPTIVFKQDAPDDDNTSIYHVFERLNTGGTKLTPQEVRNCVDSGNFVKALIQENQANTHWREIFGPVSRRSKDVELILRFLALFYQTDKYSRPMKDFLNRFSKSNKNAPAEVIKLYMDLFRGTIEFINVNLGVKPFRRGTGFNAAVFDAVMVAVAQNRRSGLLTSGVRFRDAYEGLLADEQFIDATSASTADENNVKRRLQRAKTFLVD